MEKYLAKYNVTKQAAPGIDLRGAVSVRRLPVEAHFPVGLGPQGIGQPRKYPGISQLAWDLKGLDNLANILAAKRPPDDKGDPLDKYLMGFGLWRPMAHKPEKSREPWHVELLPLQHQHRLDRIKSHAMQKADYIVFAVQGRQNLIRREHNDELLKTNRSIIDARALAKNTSSLLKRFNVPHGQRYIFQPVDPDSMPLLRS
jgi:hypothetical protein